MYIKNLKTGVLTEITNQDVIKYCKSNPADFELSESADNVNSGVETRNEDKPLGKMNVEELKVVAEEKGIDIDGLTKKEAVAAIQAAE